MAWMLESYLSLSAGIFAGIYVARGLYRYFDAMPADDQDAVVPQLIHRCFSTPPMT